MVGGKFDTFGHHIHAAETASVVAARGAAAIVSECSCVLAWRAVAVVLTAPRATAGAAGAGAWAWAGTEGDTMAAAAGEVCEGDACHFWDQNSSVPLA